MRRWFVQDSEGREIYLTEEQWEHILSRHRELRNHRNDVLKTIRQGRRRQQPQDPQVFVYQLPCPTLRPPFNAIMVVVAFRFEQLPTEAVVANNFVITAWGIVMRRNG